MGSNTIYNLLSMIFITLSLVVVVITAGWTSETIPIPDVLAPPTDVPIPEVLIQVSWTPSVTPLPSDTPLATDTLTPTNTWTATHTQSPTATITPLPTETPLPTSTVTPSSTATRTNTPAPPTLTPLPSLTPSVVGPTVTPSLTVAPFPFRRESLEIRPDLNGDCMFQGFGGDVFDLEGNPENGLQIIVTGPNLPAEGVIGVAGTNGNYSAAGGGWEVRVGDAPNANRYRLRLVDPGTGADLAAPTEFTFNNNCNENLVLVRFRQVRPR